MVVVTPTTKNLSKLGLRPHLLSGLTMAVDAANGKLGAFIGVQKQPTQVLT
jgi:hypothetical protein